MSPQEQNKHSYRKIVIAAAAVTVAVNGLFVVLFDHLPATPQVRSSENQFRTMMLDLSATQRHWYPDALNWMKYQNPSLMSRPDYRFGYSSYAKMPLYRATLPALVLEPPALVPVIPVLPFDLLQPALFPSPVATRAERQGLRTVDPRSISIVYSPNETYIYPLVVVNGVPIRKIRFGAVNVPANSKPTRLRLSQDGGRMLPRAVITGSSGSAELDREAVRVLLEYTNRSPVDEWSGHDVIVYWQKEEVEG